MLTLTKMKWTGSDSQPCASAIQIRLTMQNSVEADLRQEPLANAFTRTTGTPRP